MPLGAPTRTPRRSDGQVLTFHSPQDRERRVPAFTKWPDPWLVSTQTTQSSILWPWLFRAAGRLPDPLDTWYCYYSTSHGTAGGIFLATAPSLRGPWTDRGLIYQDTTAGDQTETPSVLWDEVNGRANLYYSQRTPGGVAVQATLLATSANGRSGWTRRGVVVDWLNSGQFASFAGSSHMGYFRPFRAGALWMGYHLLSANDKPLVGVSYSHDGVTWQTDPRALGGYHDLLTAGTQRRLNWINSAPIVWRGQPWLVCHLANFVSGTADKDARIGLAPLAPDCRRITAPPTVIWTPTLAWESADLSSVYPVQDGDRLFVAYQCRTGGQNGTYRFGMLEAAL